MTTICRRTISWMPLSIALALCSTGCAVEPDPTGTWVSAESETPRVLILEDDRLRGTWGRESADGRHPAGSYELTRTGTNRYAGTARATWQCWYYERGYRRENACSAEYPIELTVTNDDRIEGRLFMPGLDDRLDNEERARACDACDGNRESVWQGFLWVREDPAP